MLHTLAIGMPGLFEWVIIGGVGLLIFGKRLPEVGRALAQTIGGFKNELRKAERAAEIEDATRALEPPRNAPAQ